MTSLKSLIFPHSMPHIIDNPIPNHNDLLCPLDPLEKIKIKQGLFTIWSSSRVISLGDMGKHLPGNIPAICEHNSIKLLKKVYPSQLQSITWHRKINVA